MSRVQVPYAPFFLCQNLRISLLFLSILCSSCGSCRIRLYSVEDKVCLGRISRTDEQEEEQHRNRVEGAYAQEETEESCGQAAGGCGHPVHLCRSRGGCLCPVRLWAACQDTDFDVRPGGLCRRGAAAPARGGHLGHGKVQ